MDAASKLGFHFFSRSFGTGVLRCGLFAARASAILWLWGFACAPLHAQVRQPPHVGYAFPAGAQLGTVCQCVVGGQFLEGTKDVYVSGSGVRATVDHYDKPLSQKRVNELRNYIDEARKKAVESGTVPAALQGMYGPERMAVILKEEGATEVEIKKLFEMRKQRNDPKRQQNQQISEMVTINVEVAPDAQAGPHELRLLTPSGLSNPLTFCVGSLPEQRDEGARNATLEKAQRVSLPVVLNGQILPGGVDRFAFEARQGMHLVIAVQARDIVPFLADAVPGWFQPVSVLTDSKGREVAYGSDYRFSPDPIFCYDVLETGVYNLEIRDALYRGREDFVFRITAGEIPFITSIFPLGGGLGDTTAVDVTGWNLPNKHFVLKSMGVEGIRRVGGLVNGLPTVDPLFAVDSLPFCVKQPRKPGEAQEVKLPVIINGRIDPAGDVDTYAFSCSGGAKVVAEVNARRLNSPLDSWLKVTDAKGRQLAFNDDWEDKGAGLLTVQADSYLTFTTPATGRYFLHIGDSQGKGGAEFGYRLRISVPRPDFALRIAPSCINSAAGATVPVTVYALRKDGFSGEIALNLKDGPAGMVLDGGLIPSGQDNVRATLTFPQGLAEQPMKLLIEGHATIEGNPVTRQAVAAEDMTQAFVIHHLVQENQLLAVVTDGNRGRAPLSIVSREPMKLPAGGTGKVVISSSLRAVPFILTETQLQLSDPPSGITVGEVSTTPQGAALSFRADAKAKPGTRGNLIVETFMERSPPNAPSGKAAVKRRFSVGFLPAIPFEVTGP